MFTRILFCLLVVCLPRISLAQFTREYAPWPVVIGAGTLELPFWGGINSPKPSLVDFDDDGLIDLMIGETRGKVSYLRNTGSASQPSWTPIADRLAGINTGTWHRFCDIDADGDLDLLCDAGNGMTAFYRNESVGSNISFTFVKDNFGGFETGLNVTGDFADLDDDGDLDFFLGSLTGELWQYRNDGDSANPFYVIGSLFYDSVYAFPGGLAKDAKQPQHGFSTITFSDHDSDGDQDLFWGDINNNNTYYFANLGTPSVSDLTEISESYFPFESFGLNHTAFADLDDDADADALVGAANGDDIDNLVLLRNQGTPAAPLYVLEDSNLVENFDVGSYAIPALGDLDGDGDSDLIVGRGDGRLTYFQNVGTTSSASFLHISDFYKSIDVGLSAAPALVDWDSDGDFDLLIGSETTGRIAYWRNEGSPANFNPVLQTNQLGGIQVDILSVPVPVDWNDDGLIDLVVGEWDFNGFANVLLYENTGTVGSPVLTLVTTRLLKRVPRDFTLPTVYDWDCDGRKDLILGQRTFGSTLYRNTSVVGAFPDSMTLIPQPDTLPWADDGYRLIVALADMDGDLLRDAFVGEEDGGINFYRRDADACSCPTHGDFNDDELASVLDVVFTVNVAFRNETDLDESECCPHIGRMDHNCDCQINILDVVTIVTTAFRNGPPSCNPCAPGNQCPR